MKKAFIPVMALAAFGLFACNGQNPSSSAPSVSSSQASVPVVNTLTIKNKATIEKTLHQYDLSFTLEIETDVPINVLQELAAGRLKVETSNSAVLAVNGLGLSVGIPGEATITISHGQASDSITFTVQEMVENSIQEIIAMPKDKVVNFWAQITGNYGDSGIFVGNGDYGILLYKTILPSTLKIGDKVLVTGAKTAPYNGLPELSGANLRVPASFPESKVATPTVLSFENAPLPTFEDGKQSSRPATVKGAKILAIKESTKDYNSKAMRMVEATVEVGGSKFLVYIDGRYAAKAVVDSWYVKREGAEKAELLRANDVIDFSGFTYINSNKPQFVLSKVSKVTEYKGKYAVNVVDGIENGTVAISASGEVDYGAEVTVTATPAEGYQLAKISVKNAAGSETNITADAKFKVYSDSLVTAVFEKIPTSAAELPAGGITIEASNVQDTYAKNKNQEIKVGGIDFITDSASAGCLTVNKDGGEGWGYKTANGGQNLLQSKKMANAVFLETKEPIASATSVTATFYTTYSTNTDAKYYPSIKFGNTVVTATVGEGVNTGLKSASTGGYDIYKFEVSYDISALDAQKISFITTNNSTCYFAHLKIA